jgi:NADH-quinone oxidoreductase subunit N
MSFEILFFLFSSIILTAGLVVITARNPIHSVLFMILVFVNVVFILLFLEAEFLALTFVIVYVGAVAVLFLFVVMMLECLCFCNELLLLYLTIELQSLTLYIFATFNRNSEFSTEAGLKYFVFGGLMSCFLLFGLCLIYTFYGSISFELIFSVINQNFNPIFFFGFFFVIIVLMFKVGCVPFHF